ncbi:MAG: DNA primase [Candidatus Gracilibacteria bacterium]
MQDSVSEIKAKLSIEDIVAPYVQLKRGGKYLKACCPFHQEKTPSFYVSPERQLAYCFACNKGGDMFQFIQDIEGVDFRGALEILAEKAHVDLPKESGKISVNKEEKDRFKAICNDASKFFVQELWKGGEAEKVLLYLKSRGVTDDTLRTFLVGFAPDGKDTLYRYLLEKKHEKSDILETTVALSRDSAGSEIVDRFRLRLMFPIDNVSGDIIGFGGRALKKGEQPKYLNSAEYALYHKGELLFNLSRAKAFIKKEDFVLFVEGYFDTMASWQAGVFNTVATSGTALTEEQFKLVKRFTKKVALAFDSDSAGQEALLRAVHTAQTLGLEIFVVEIPSGKDAADTVKENPELWVGAVTNRKPYLEYFFDKLSGKNDLRTPSGKKDFTDSFLEILKGVSHPTDLDHYIKKLSTQVGTPVEMLYDYLNRVKNAGNVRHIKKNLEEDIKKPGISKKDRLSLYFLGLLLAFPKEFFELWKSLKDFKSFSELVQKIGLIKQFNKLEESKYNEFYESFPAILCGQVSGTDITSVYKQVEDHYNLVGMVDESFYRSFEQVPSLQKMAFEAEVSGEDSGSVESEFVKLLALLYFESLT